MPTGTGTFTGERREAPPRIAAASITRDQRPSVRSRQGMWGTLCWHTDRISSTTRTSTHTDSSFSSPGDTRIRQHQESSSLYIYPEASTLNTGYDRLLDLATRGNEALYAVNNVTYTPGRDIKGISELRYEPKSISRPSIGANNHVTSSLLIIFLLGRLTETFWLIP